MDLNPTPEDTAFRDEVRAFLRDRLPPEIARHVGDGEALGKADYDLWHARLNEKGWLAGAWPKAFGGQEWSAVQKHIFEEECALANAPRIVPFGVAMLAPVLMAFGSKEQQAHYLPRILSGQDWWCQGYSEPGAGSDLAGVSTTARLDDGRWIVNGQKIWTSLAHVAQWVFVLCRTEPGSTRHSGLSFLLVPIDQPGVTVRPIQQLTGTSEFNEVFFDDAVADADLIVGEPGDGWKVAMGLLQFERGVSTLGQQVGFARELDNLVDTAKSNGAIDDPEIASRLARASIGLKVMGAHAQRTLDGDVTNQAGAASVSKLLWANWHRDLGELAMDVVGAPSLIAPAATVEGVVNDITDPENVELDDWQRLFLFTRADTIYGGSNEVQRNIIAERVLGLPREARQS